MYIYFLMIMISAKDQLFLSHSSFQCLETASENIVEMLHPDSVSGTPAGFLSKYAHLLIA